MLKLSPLTINDRTVFQVTLPDGTERTGPAAETLVVLRRALKMEQDDMGGKQAMARWFRDAAKSRVLYGTGDDDQNTRAAELHESGAAAIAKTITAIQAAIVEVEQTTVARAAAALLDQSQAAIAQAVAALPHPPEEHEHV